MNASRLLLCLGLWLVTALVQATPLAIKDGPFVWMRGTLTDDDGGMVLDGSIRRTAPRTVRALRGHVHLYLDDKDGRELSSFAVPYHPVILSRGGRASTFALHVPTPDRPVAGGRLEHHLDGHD